MIYLFSATHSHNSCGLTAQLYLDVLHTLLELSLKTDSALSALQQLPLGQLKTLLSDASEHCFSNHSAERGLFSSNLSEAYFRLMILVASHRIEISKALSDFSVLEMGDLLCRAVTCTENKCLIRLGLKALNSSSFDFEDKVNTAVRPKLLELVQAENDSDILTEVNEVFLAGCCAVCLILLHTHRPTVS